MPNLTPKDRIYALHEQVLQTLEDQLSEPEVSPKTLELAMRFLKDNNVAVDLTKVNEGKPKLAIIPRLTEQDILLG